VPFTAKDLTDATPYATTYGSRPFAANAPASDASCIARLRRAGAVLIGKTNTPEMGARPTTENELFGATRNPHDTARTPGGSSGGAAAALALGIGTLAQGSDGGGSIRIPAACCGVVGHKPTRGLVSGAPATYDAWEGFATNGPLARTVADCALMLNVLSQPDPRDWTALPYAEIDWTRGLDAGVKGLRIAYSPRLAYVKHVDTEVEARVADAAKVLAGLGAVVEAVDPGFADCRDVFWVHWTAGAYNLLRNMPKEKFALLDPGLQQATASGAQHTLARYLDAVNARGALGEQMKRFHQKYDLLLTPSTAIPAFAAGVIAPERPAGEEDWTWWTPFSFPFNLTQQPAMSVPCGFSGDGLPVGLHLVGPRQREDLVLRAAHAYQQATGHHLRRPPL
jgi:aspartyl-tRNA(Asn)/glutamyl-tRNA(Gln) amidotransferase subunit A